MGKCENRIIFIYKKKKEEEKSKIILKHRI